MTDCQDCTDYLTRRRNILLPFIGHHVLMTGRPPAKFVRTITDHFHKLGHPHRTPTRQPTEGDPA